MTSKVQLTQHSYTTVTNIIQLAMFLTLAALPFISNAWYWNSLNMILQQLADGDKQKLNSATAPFLGVPVQRRWNEEGHANHRYYDTPEST